LFEGAEVGSKLAKKDYEERVPQLRVDLLNAQYDLRHADFPVLLLLVGNDRAACNDVVNLLNEWMDPHFIDTCVFGDSTDEEAERPRLWRYWRALPGRGELTIFAGDWVLATMRDRLEGRIDDAGFDRRIEHMAELERQLVNGGALVLKYWLHLPRKELKKRVRKAEKNGNGHGAQAEGERLLLDVWDEVLPLSERILRKTASDTAPWALIESTDRRHRSVTVAESMLRALESRLAHPPAPAEASAAAAGVVTTAASVLDSVDLSARIERPDYKRELEDLQQRLGTLSVQAREAGMSSVLVFEGWDASGKGGAIRRLTSAMDVQDYRVIPIAAPTDEELAHHYLWRFWRRLPRAGRMVLFDRSWYGRVLVERIEGLTAEARWRRSYAEINDFEEQMVEHGWLLQKFWLHTDAEEQQRRFDAREHTPFKKYKITAEDYRNREHRADYERAIHEMVSRTSTDLAPWKLVAANDKRWARLEVLRSVCGGLEKRLAERS